jgi:membrane-associated progesterone receptor component
MMSQIYPSITTSDLSKCDGSGETVYVAIKGVVFDVSENKKMYTPGTGYSCFAGRDASKALGMSSTNLQDCIADYSELTDDQVY